MSDDVRLAIGAALCVVVLALVVYGLSLGAQRYAASEAAQTQSEERLEREGESPWQREISPATT